MPKLIPQLWIEMRNYSKEKFFKDFISGIIVAIIALPLSIALALASGVGPEEGLYTAIIAGFIIAAFGGSSVQISGPTAAFATIVAGIVARNGLQGLMTATIIAGIILVIMGLLRMGNLIKFIPYTITAGFTAGIAVTIIIGQMKDFLGLIFMNKPVETIEKLSEVIACIGTLNHQAMAVGIGSLIILIIGTKFLPRIPASLIAVILTSFIVKFFGLNVNTIGDLFNVSGALPTLHMPNFSYNVVAQVLPDAFTIAILAAIESLLSAVVADEMIDARHNSNMELIAQGLGNTASALFGGIPATGAIARTAANIKSGGSSPISGMIHSIVLLLILVILMPYAALIPMPCIAAILLQVAYNMSGWRIIVNIIKRAPQSDVIILVLTFFLTVFFDLVIAITVGIILASILLMKRLADVSTVREWTYIEDVKAKGDININDPIISRLKEVPDHVMVYEIVGPMFFGAVAKIPHITDAMDKSVLIIRMRAVPTLDISAVRGFERLWEECTRHKMHMVLSHVNEQPMEVLRKAGMIGLIGENNFQPNIDAALERAKYLRNIGK